MPPRARKASAPTVGARHTEKPDVLDPKPVAVTSTSAGGRRRKVGAAPKEAPPIRKTPIRKTPTRETRVKPEETSSPIQVDAPTVPQRAARKVQRSFYVDVDVLEDARAAVTYLGAYVPEAGVQSLADLVNPGLSAMVKQLQDTYNDGKPFRRVSHMQVGRPPSR